jgi:BASS family bile acid:Na+ symporter
LNGFIKSHFVYFLTLSLVAGFFLAPALGGLNFLVIPLLSAIMVCSFLSVDYRLILNRIKKPKDLILAFVVMKVIVPVVLYYSLRSFDSTLAVGILLISAAPVAAVAPTITGLCRGDVELVLMLLVVTTILSPFTLPLTMNLLTGSVLSINVRGMILSLLQIIIVPLGLAWAAKRFLPGLIKKSSPYLSSLSVIILTFMLMILMAQGAGAIKAQPLLVARYFIATLLLTVILAAAGYYIFAFLPRPARIGLSLCMAYINVGLIIVIASRYFPVEVLILTLVFEMPMNILPGLIKKFTGRALQKQPV